MKQGNFTIFLIYLNGIFDKLKVTDNRVSTYNTFNAMETLWKAFVG